VLPASDGSIYTPEGYIFYSKNIISSPGTACK
jgi:hypothetical protein